MVPSLEKVDFYQEKPSEIPPTGFWFAETRVQSTAARSLCEKTQREGKGIGRREILEGKSSAVR